MNKRFYIVRHGEKIKRISDPPLSDIGVLQAKATGKYFRAFSIGKIISSPILRAKQTAELIASYLSLDVITDELLKERINWGDDPKQIFDEFLKMWKRTSIDRNWMPPIGDSSRNAGNRLNRIINLQDGSENQIVLVTHGGITADFLRNYFSEMTLNSAYENFSDILEESMSECSITTVDFNPENKSYKLIDLASTKHLKRL